MEGAGYVDIFATKGIEYLLVIGFLMLLVAFWRLLAGSGTYAGAHGLALAPWFSMAEALYYHQGHTWAAPEGDDIVRVGMDDFAQKLVGVPERIDVPYLGDAVGQGEHGVKLRVAAGRRIELLSPVSGQVLAVNNEVIRNPHLVNDDPYGAGWIMKVRVPRLEANLRNLLNGRLARAWMEGTVAALQARMSRELGPVLQDGGVPVTGFARDLAAGEWEEMMQEFLLT